MNKHKPATALYVAAALAMLEADGQDHRRDGDAMQMNRFPVGGPREPVYAFMREHGFTPVKWTDKEWRKDGRYVALIYGAGSMVRLSKHSRNKSQHIEGALETLPALLRTLGKIE